MNPDSRQFRVYPDMVGRMDRRGGAFLADNATVIGDARLGRDVSIWFGVTLRADDAPITVGAATNIQDNTVVHVDLDAPLTVGEGVTIGHGVILHGVAVGDYTLLGMGSIVLGGARIGDHAIIGAGTVVVEGAEIPPGVVVLGVPGKIVRRVTDEERAAMSWRARHYVERARSYLPGYGA